VKARIFKPLERRVAERVRRKKGDVFIRDDFRDLGGYDQVGRALKRLVERGEIVKLGYGLYARATKGPLTGKVVPTKDLPTLASEGLRRLGKETVPSSYARAYNAGQTTQVPTGRVIGVRDRVSRRIGYDGKFVSLERVP